MANRKSDQERAFAKASDDAKTAMCNIEYFTGLVADLDKERALLMSEIEFNINWHEKSLKIKADAEQSMKTKHLTFEVISTEESSDTSSDESDNSDDSDESDIADVKHSKADKLPTLKRYRWQSDESSSEDEEDKSCVKRFKTETQKLDSVCTNFANIAIV